MQQLDIFGSELYEYLFVIEPDQKTTEKIIELKMAVNSLVPLSEEVLHSKPHISICYFEASDFSDDYILTKANQVFSSILSFDVQLEGPEIWKNGTLVLKVIPNENTLEVQKQLSTVFKGVIKSLHLTIVRNVSEALLNQPLIKSFDYKGHFNCKSITLLRKKGNTPYQVVEKIHLN